MNGEGNERTTTQLAVPLARHCRQVDPSRVVQISSLPYLSTYHRREDPSIHDHNALRCHYTALTGRESGQTGAHSIVHEFGFQSLPSIEALREIGVTSLWPPDWETIAAHNGRQTDLVQYESDRPPARDAAELVLSSQLYQGEALRYYIDHYRCHRFTRCNGLFQFQLVDCWPAATWSIADYRREPKASLAYVREAFAPRTVVPDCPPVFCLPGDDLEVPVYVVNDLRETLRSCQVGAMVVDPEGEPLARLACSHDVESNVAQQVDTLRWRVPPDSGDVDLRLVLWLADHEGHDVARRNDRILVRSRGPVHIMEPAFAKDMPLPFGWELHQGREATLTREEEAPYVFVRFGGARAGDAWMINRMPLRGIRPGEAGELALEARAPGDGAEGCSVVLGLGLTGPTEANPVTELVHMGEAIEAVRVPLTADGAWHQLRATVVIPSWPSGTELHLKCGFDGAPGSTLDVTSFSLTRSADLTRQLGRVA
jgi:hypothetical protein